MQAPWRFICVEHASLAPMLIVLLLTVFQPIAVRGDAQTGSVSGTVYGFTCRGELIPLSGATVSAILIQTGYTSQPVTTGPGGSFNLTLSPGEYKLFVTAEFFKTQDSYSFTITSGTALRDFYFYLDPKTSTYCQIIPYQNFLETFVVYSNASTSDIVYDSSKRMINLTANVANASVTRFLFAVPRALIDGAPVILVDNVEVASNMVEGSNYYFVKFEVSPGSHNATVRGSMAIPEISRLGQLLVTALCLALAVFILTYSKSRLPDNNYQRARSVQLHGNPSIGGILL